MLNLVALIGFAVSVVSLGFFLYHQYRPKYQYPIKYRITTHEAGHTLAAWACTLVGEITSINTIEGKDGGRGGLTCFTIYGKTIRGMWCDLVITLAGIAAEANIYGRFRSIEAEEDLKIAWKLSQQLASQNQLVAPWELPQTPNLSFDKIYKQVSLDQKIILEQAYVMARHLLLKHKQRYSQLMNSLIEHPILTEQEVNNVLGARRSITALSPNVLFI